MLRSRWIVPALVVGFSALSALSAVGRPETPEVPEPSARLDRVVVVGASVSNGFGSGLPFSTLLDVAIRPKHTPVENACRGIQNPAVFGEMQLARALTHRPTLVIAVDFLFWFAHRTASHGEDELELRLESLRAGLELLERFSCPLVIGDIPDMRTADSKRLIPALIPTPEVRDALNTELRRWSRGKKVLVVPLAEWVAVLQRGEWIIEASADGAHEEKILTAKEALQGDRLHPEPIGAIVLMHRILEAMVERFPRSASKIEFDIWKVHGHFEKIRAAHRRGEKGDGG